MKSELASLAHVVGPHGMVLLDGEQGFVETSNHAQWARVPCEFATKPIVVNYVNLMGFISKAGEPDKIEVSGSRAVFKANGSRITLPIDPEPHWTRREATTGLVGLTVAPETIKYLSLALGPPDDPRPHCAGIQAYWGGLLATNGKWIMWCGEPTKIKSAIFPPQFTNLISDTAELEVGERFARATVNAAIYESSLFDYPIMNLPNWPDPSKSFTVDAGELRQALSLCETASESVVISVIDGSAKFRAIADMGASEIESEIQASGDDFDFVVTAKILRAASMICKDTVTLRFENENYPLRIDSGIYSAALTPQRR